MTQKTKPDPKKVEDLKEKARTTGATSQSILYGSQNDNQNASGTGEFDQ